MVTATKIVVLGGSSVGTPALIDALERQTPTQAIELVLHGRTHDKLAPVAHVCELMARGRDWLHVTATTELAQALDGADYVINQVRVGGLVARAFDETFPIPLGILGEETVGPGGFANSLRTVPQVVKLVAEIEKHAPDALLLSFTNPASVIQYAVTLASKMRVIGLCDAPVTMIGQAAQACGVDPSMLTVDYVGMHHFGFITRTLCDGHDVTQTMLDGLERVSSLDMDVDLVRALGALPTPYFKYFLHADRILERQQAQKQSRAEQLLAIERDLLAEYAASNDRPGGISKRGAKWYDAIIAPVLMTLIEGRSASFILNVVNEKQHGWLPADAIIETPCLLDAGQVRPLAMPAPSRKLQALIRLNCAYEQAMVEAILEQSEAKALSALLLSPLIPNATVARAILKRIWPNAEPN